MASTYEQIYNASPWALKEVLVYMEAWRRSRYRRYGDYSLVRNSHNFSYYSRLLHEHQSIQIETLNIVLRRAREKTEFYTYLPGGLRGISDLQNLPLVTKQQLQQQMQQLIASDSNPKHLWNGLTSGSTGTPLRFYVGREGIRARFAIQDEYYSFFGCHYTQRRVRFGGSKIAPADREYPPFWVMNHYDNQLQMSPYHLSRNNMPSYIEKLCEFKPKYITGYAHAIYNLCEYLLEGEKAPSSIQAVFTDSEGISPNQVAVIEEALGVPVYDVYGLGEVGWVAVQCKQKKYHVLERTCILEIVDDNGYPVPDGESGHIVITDLTQSAVPYIRYDTGDIGRFSTHNCNCGWQTRILDSIEGRSDEMIITPSGRKIGRLSHVTKPAKGILESQIVQLEPARVVIRVVPLATFDPASMEDVVEVAHSLIGNEVEVSWETVTSIPRTNMHKFKHVVREFTL